jgi:hypothetical protein
VTTSVVQGIKNEIERKEAEIDALKIALAALGGVVSKDSVRNAIVGRARKPRRVARQNRLASPQGGEGASAKGRKAPPS